MASKFRIPNVIITGHGAHQELKKLPELKNKKSALFITDNVKIEADIEKQCKNDLSSLGIAITEFHEMSDKVSPDSITAGLDRATNCDADLVVAMGGRVAIKTGKLIAMLITNDGNIEDYKNSANITIPPITLVAIATTASSGAAISNCACYNDDVDCVRCCIADIKLTPTVAILDPGLSSWLSPQEIAQDGLISIGYAVEALASDYATPVTDACALEAITSLIKWLPESYAHSSSLEAREKLMYAQQLVSMARNNARSSLLCKLSGQLEVQTHIPLGSAVAALLPWVIEHYEETIPERMSIVERAILLGDSTLSVDQPGHSTADEIRSIIQRLDMPLRLSFLGFEEEQIESVVDSLVDSTLESYTPLHSDKGTLTDLLTKAL